MIELQMIGFIGKDAVEITKKDGSRALAFDVGETAKYGGKQVTTWVNCYTTQLHLAPYLKKGTQVFVRGGFYIAPTRHFDNDTENDAEVRVNCAAFTIHLISTEKVPKRRARGAFRIKE